MTQIEFLNKVQGNFPNYDFSQTNFININTKINVICKEHGLFSILPSNMLYKNEGCKFCGIENMSKSKAFTKQEFIKKANIIFKGTYDYTLTEYKNNKTKIKIICKKCGTIFEQYPCNHLKGYGCPKCKKAR